MRVQSLAKSFAGPFAHQVEMRDLPERMHAGIGAAGAADGRRPRW